MPLGEDQPDLLPGMKAPRPVTDPRSDRLLNPKTESTTMELTIHPKYNFAIASGALTKGEALVCHKLDRMTEVLVELRCDVAALFRRLESGRYPGPVEPQQPPAVRRSMRYTPESAAEAATDEPGYETGAGAGGISE